MTLADLFAISPALLIGCALVLGLVVGSFLNVVIHRLPIMLNRQWQAQCEELAGRAPQSDPENRFDLVVPRSACPACKTPIKARHNVPIVSYLLLKGRCAACGAKISARYPFVEILTGLVSAAVAWKFGFGWPLAGALVLSWFLIALTFIDIDHQLLPDSLTLPLLWIGLVATLCLEAALLDAGSATAAASDGARAAATLGFPADLRSSVIGALAGYLSLWSVYHLFRLLTGKEGMGYGDFKLLAALGAWLGWQMLLPIILMAAAVGAVVGIVVLAAQGRNRSTPIPFGPFLAAAGWIMLMTGPEIVQRYLGLFGPPR